MSTLDEIRKDDGTWSDEYVAADRHGLIAQRRTLLALLDAQSLELQATKTSYGLLCDRLETAEQELQAVREALPEIQAKAERWDALMKCRMRTLGGAKVKDFSDPWTYITMEFWTGHPDPTDQPWIFDYFESFMTKARAALKQSRGAT